VFRARGQDPQPQPRSPPNQPGAFSFVAASHRCATPIARSAPAVVSATETARANRTIFSTSQRDISRTPSSRHPGSAARFDVMQFAYVAGAAKEMPPQIVSAAEALSLSVRQGGVGRANLWVQTPHPLSLARIFGSGNKMGIPACRGRVLGSRWHSAAK